MRAAVIDIIVLLALVAGVGLALAAAAPLRAWLRQRQAAATDARIKVLWGVAEHAIAIAVAAVQQRFVATLKDPTREGHWSVSAGDSAREAAIRAARRSIPGVLAELERLGVAELDDLLGQFVEANVLELKARSAAKPAAPSAPPPTPPTTPLRRAGDERDTVPDIRSPRARVVPPPKEPA